MRIIKGIDVANSINEEIFSKTAQVLKKPCLATVRIGERGDDISYEKGAVKKMNKLNLEHKSFVFDADISNEQFLKELSKINNNDEIDGILLFRPLPKQIDEKAVIDIINPDKDIDCISRENIAKLFIGESDGFVPCTAQAVMEAVHFAGIDLNGKKVVVLGRSMVIGKPLSMLMLKENATVTICHSKTKQLKDECKRADILVCAIGKSKFIDDKFVKDGAVVIDVGINVDENGNITGDVDFDKVAEKTSVITPVPGGIGAITTSVLAKQLVKAYFKQNV